MILHYGIPQGFLDAQGDELRDHAEPLLLDVVIIRNMIIMIMMIIIIIMMIMIMTIILYLSLSLYIYIYTQYDSIQYTIN